MSIFAKTKEDMEIVYRGTRPEVDTTLITVALNLCEAGLELEDRVKELELENAALKREMLGEMEKY